MIPVYLGINASLNHMGVLVLHMCHMLLLLWSQPKPLGFVNLTWSSRSGHKTLLIRERAHVPWVAIGVQMRQSLWLFAAAAVCIRIHSKDVSKPGSSQCAGRQQVIQHSACLALGHAEYLIAAEHRALVCLVTFQDTLEALERRTRRWRCPLRREFFAPMCHICQDRMHGVSRDAQDRALHLGNQWQLIEINGFELVKEGAAVREYRRDIDLVVSPSGCMGRP